MEKKRSYFCNCLYFSTSALARRLNRLAEESFAPSGLAPSYAFVIMTVNRVPGISPSAIAQELQMQPSTITRFLDKMEGKGYLRRESEGKSIRVYPTDKSLEINAKLQECWEALYDRYKEMLGSEMAKDLANAMVIANDRMQ